MNDDRIDEEPAHSPLGPSAAARWATCPGSVAATRDLPDTPSLPAAEGTAAHMISHDCLSEGTDADSHIGRETQILDWTFVWTEEDAMLLQPGLDRFRSVLGAEYGELRVDISRWTRPGQFGTLDRAKITDDYIHIVDLKWGRWPVYATENLQLILYALGFWNDIARHVTEATRFILEIDQPRCAGGGGVWETDLQTLLRWGAWLLERAEATEAPDAPFIASEAGCVWCRLRTSQAGCPTYEAFNTALIGAKFEEEPTLSALVPTQRLSPEERAFVLSHRKMIETWLDLLAEQELEDFLAGRPTPGRKAVIDNTRGKRDAWASESDAAKALNPLLGAKSFTSKLITPIQAGKLLDKDPLSSLLGGAAVIEPLIIRGEKGKVMVPVEDARPPVPVLVFEEAEEIEDEKSGEITP